MPPHANLTAAVGSRCSKCSRRSPRDRGHLHATLKKTWIHGSGLTYSTTFTHTFPGGNRKSDKHTRDTGSDTQHGTAQGPPEHYIQKGSDLKHPNSWVHNGSPLHNGARKEQLPQASNGRPTPTSTASRGRRVKVEWRRIKRTSKAFECIAGEAAKAKAETTSLQKKRHQSNTTKCRWPTQTHHPRANKRGKTEPSEGTPRARSH